MEHDGVPILQLQHRKNIEMVIANEENAVLPVTAQLTCNSICAFSKHENDTFELEERSKSAMKLSGLIIFYLIVMAVEIIGGLKANSLAVITDAAHLLTDVAGFCISLFTVWASGWKATSQHSFGFSRLEVLGALLSVQLIWVISGILVYEAIDRILHKNSEVNGGLMFAIAAFGFIINLIMIIWLGHDHSHHAFHDHDRDHDHDHDHDHDDHNHDHDHDHNHDHDHDHDHDHSYDHDHDHIHNHEVEELCAVNEEEGAKLVPNSPPKRKILNINIQGAYLHVMADLIQSVGVMVAGAIIWAKPDWLVVDLISTLVFSAFVLFSTIPMLMNIFSILMEKTPHDINVDSVESGLKCVQGVQDIHDLHVWAITLGKLVLSCHVVAEPGASSTELLNRIRDYCEKTYKIHHVTVQIEQ